MIITLDFGMRKQSNKLLICRRVQSKPAIVALFYCTTVTVSASRYHSSKLFTKYFMKKSVWLLFLNYKFLRETVALLSL